MDVSSGAGGRHGSHLVLLWLWCRLAVAVLIGPLAWELSYAAGMALKRQKKKKSVYGVHKFLSPEFQEEEKKKKMKKIRQKLRAVR